MKSEEAMIADIVRQVLAGQEGQSRPAESGKPLFHNTRDITLDAAEALMKRVEAKAARMGMRVVTAVSDSHGNPVAVRCMDGAYMGSFDVALNKTYTAIAFQMSTATISFSAIQGRLLSKVQPFTMSPAALRISAVSSTRAGGLPAPAPGKELYGIQYTNRGRIVIFGGGVLLKKDGQILGAFGVSGGSAQQDTELARYAQGAFEEIASTGV